jgi:integrase
MRSSAGSITKVDKDRWRVTVSLGRDKKGKRIRRSKQIRGSRRDAELLRAKMLMDDELPSEKLTLADVTEQWLELKRETVRPSTYVRYEQNAGKIYRSNFANVKIKDTEKMEYEVRKWIENETGEGAKLNAYKTLRQVLNYAKRNHLITVPVTDFIEPPRLSPKEKKTISSSEIPNYLNAVKGSFIEGGVLLMLGCGLRRSEALGLRWDDIAWEDESGHFTVERGCYIKPEGGIYFDEPKTLKSRREIVLPSWVAKRLKELKHGEYVCENEEGVLSPDVFSRTWSRLLKRANLPHIQLKNLRHSCGTILVRELEMPIGDVQQLLGHTSSRTTENFYVQKSNVSAQRVADAMSKIDV